MGRPKKRNPVWNKRAQALAATRGTVIVNGRSLEPGTPEYEHKLRKMVEMLSAEEFQEFIDSAAEPRSITQHERRGKSKARK